MIPPLYFFIQINCRLVDNVDETHSGGSALAQLVESRTLDRKVAGWNLTRGTVLCP